MINEYTEKAEEIVAKWKDTIHYLVDAELNSDKKAYDLFYKDKVVFNRYVKDAVECKIYRSKRPKVINLVYFPISFWDRNSHDEMKIVRYIHKRLNIIVESITLQIVTDWSRE